MRLMLAASLALAVASCAGRPAFAESAKPNCVSVSVPQGAVAAHDGKWEVLTKEQWQFLRGIYVLNPNTASGLPFGDGAALAIIPGNPQALVFFIDGDLACQPMPLPAELVTLLRDTPKVYHAKDAGDPT